MKQTSSAVATLLMMGSASAFLSANLQQITAGMATWTPQSTGTIDWTGTPAAQPAKGGSQAGPKFAFTVSAAGDYSNLETDGAQTNMQVDATGGATSPVIWNPTCTSCIMLGGIWCSGAWSYEAAAAFTFPVQTGTFGTAQNDMGQCCFGNNDGAGAVVQVNLTDIGDMTDAVYNKNSCPAIFNVAYSVSANALVAADINGLFWCSNGWYYKSSAAFANPGFSQFKEFAYCKTDGTAGAACSNSDYLQNLTDFYLISCRQRADMCGSGTITFTTEISEVLRPIQYTDVTGGATEYYALRNGEKCSYAVVGTTGAPVFSMGVPATQNSVAGTLTNASTVGTDLAPGWTVHYLEFPAQAMTGSITNTSKNGAESQAEFPFVETGTASDFAESYWTSVGSAATTVATANDAMKSRHYGTTPAQFVNNQEYPGAMRIINKVAQNSDSPVYRYFDVHAFDLALDSYTARTTAYDALETTYNGLATTYNTQLAAYEENMAIDAFTAFFSPPEDVVVPVRPNKPTTPAAYDQMRLGNYWAYDGVSTNYQPTGSTFEQGVNVWEPYLDLGGWGQLSMGNLNSAASGYGKSYGTFGSSETATLTAYMSDLTKMGINGSFSGYYVANMDSTGCIVSTSNVGDEQTCLTAGAAANKSYLIVSLFPSFNAATFSASTGNLQFTFSQVAWRPMGSFRAPSTPDAATPALETPSGAQALATSATIALALAALY